MRQEIIEIISTIQPVLALIFAIGLYIRLTKGEEKEPMSLDKAAGMFFCFILGGSLSGLLWFLALIGVMIYFGRQPLGGP